MFRIRVALVALALVGGVAAAAPASASYDQADLQRDVNAISTAGPGILARVESGPKTLTATSGVKDLTVGGKVDPSSNFRMGSNTKVFVSTVVLQLVGEGRLKLADTVEKWLPGLVTGNGNDGRKITICQLLQHTSGLHNYTDDLAATIGSEADYQKFRFQTFTPDQLIADAMSHAPDFAPGEGWTYSNTNYVLLGLIIHQVTGHDWATEVRDRIVKPLGLTHTFAPGTDPQLPQPHTSAYLFLDQNTPIETADENMSWADAAGAMVTNAADLSRFWHTVGRGSLLRPAQVREMRTTVLATGFQDEQPGSRYGLGLGWTPLSCGVGYWTHDGDVLGYSTVSGVRDDGRMTVVISIAATADAPVKAAAHTLVDHAMCGQV